MRRLTAIFGGLTAALLVPLALSGPTAWFLIPAHGLFTVLAIFGPLAEGLAGHPGRARLWALGYLVATALMIGALELGAEVRGSARWYWGAPWLAALAWGWIPPVVSGFAGTLGEARRRRLSSAAVERRRILLSAEE